MALCLFAAELAAQPFPILDPSETVQLEHSDRQKRLIRLSKGKGTEEPEFYEYSIEPSRHGLADYDVPIPVLRVVFPARVLFDFDATAIRAEAREILETVAASLRLEPPDVTMFVAGHTDAIGSENYNSDLGLRRARAVAEALVRLGVNQAQLYDVSFGEAVPLAGNETEADRARNRRVEFLFGARPEPIAAWLAAQPRPACGEAQSRAATACPQMNSFRAESVTLKVAPVDANLSTAPKSVSFGTRVVDIDLRQKIFTFRAPQ